jgi:hypothetical protein
MNDDVAAKLYPPTGSLEQTYRAREGVEAVVLGLTPEQRKTRQDEFTSLVRDAGIQAPLADRLYELGTRVDVASARATEVEFDGQAALEDRRRELSVAYGREEGADLLARAFKFAEQHAALGRLFEHPRIRFDKDVVHGLVEHVRRENIRFDK